MPSSLQKRTIDFIILLIIGVVGLSGGLVMFQMPGKSYRGPLAPLSEYEVSLAGRLRQEIETLAGEIGERNLNQYQNLTTAAEFLESSLSGSGYTVARQEYEVEGKTCYNVEAAVLGTSRADEIVIVGAHYDSIFGSPGANDNASGAAAVLELARAFTRKKISRTLRFVEFTNEEPFYFQSPQMGSVVYAKRCRERNEKIVAMLCLETIGYYSDAPKSQSYPFPLQFFYPSAGNFIAFVGNLSSRGLTHQAIASFRRHAPFPSEELVAPEAIPGVSWSDHWSFWQCGYPAIMITDTAPYRYPYYHTELDSPDKVHYDRLARVVAGLEKVILDLVNP